ncbi:hypothetical protein Aph01nite_17980 [Acrocarpospora phusangensis]|uniref:Uncharacterized protein n=1 Tax=Acrocarpospora phusangensis TaxID=1070424 RepID=A0A919Q9U5_9ACTN|nr:hypothetical protein Aph01nite_17980 [Acrocarpospora phusangensis]
MNDRRHWIGMPGIEAELPDVSAWTEVRTVTIGLVRPTHGDPNHSVPPVV